MTGDLRGCRGDRGRGSAGPRVALRRLDPAEVRERQEHWRAQPPSADRARELTRCRVQLKNIANRAENQS